MIMATSLLNLTHAFLDLIDCLIFPYNLSVTTVTGSRCLDALGLK